MLYQILWYFFIFAFIGWCGEVIINIITRKKFSDRGFLSGPICPIYGVGVAAIYLALSQISDGPLLPLFLGSMIICSLIELFTGFAMDKIFGYKWWDYSNYRFNLGGYICLAYSVIWGIGGVIIIKMVLPIVDILLSYLPHGAGVIALIAMGGALLVDLSATIATIVGVSRQMKRLSRGEHQLAEAVAKTNLFRRRMIFAFPEMTSKKYNQQLEELKNAIQSIQKESAIKKNKKRQDVIDFYEQKIPENGQKPFAFGMCATKLFWLFMIGNVLGSAVETVWCLLTLHRFEMRTGVVFGFFIPVYGIGAVLMAVCLCKLYKKRDSWIFIGSAAIGAAVEYFCSLFQELAFGTVSWDYSNTPLNLGGRTNLMFALLWGVLGVIWVKDIYPRMARLIEKIPPKAGAALTVVLAVFIVWDMALSAAAVYRRTERARGEAPDNRIESYLDEKFPDSYLDLIYPNMSPVN